MESAIIHRDTADEKRNWGFFRYEAADAIDAFVILVARPHGGTGHADEEKTLLRYRNDTTDALNSGW